MLHITICDDEAEIVSIMEDIIVRALEELHIDAVIAKYQSGEAFLQQHRSWDEELIFMDIEMPVKSGIDVIEEMDTVNRTKNVILITAYDHMVLKHLNCAPFLFIRKENMELAKYEILEMQNREKERRIQEIKRAEFREKQLIHDYKNHCICIRNLLENRHYEEAGQYLSEIMGKQVWKEREYIHTDNDTLDALLNSKIACCEEKDIPIHFVVLGEMKNIRKMEIMVILFNLLDNAIEASELESKEKRDIEVELYCCENALEIFIKNNITSSVLLQNPGLGSHKEERGHGIGHLSVGASVEELDGVIEYYEEQGQFCAHVFVPLYTA